MAQCAADGCQRRVPDRMLACRTHWFQLPPPLRQAINETWLAYSLARRSGDRSKAQAARGPWLRNKIEAMKIWRIDRQMRRDIEGA